MTTRVTDRDDPAIQVLLSDNTLPEPFDYEHTELVVIGEEDGIPIGLMSGCIVNGYPIIEHLGLRPGFRGQSRIYELADAYLAAWVGQGHPAVIFHVNPDLPWAGPLLKAAERWQAKVYADDAKGRWYVKYAETA